MDVLVEKHTDLFYLYGELVTNYIFLLKLNVSVNSSIGHSILIGDSQLKGVCWWNQVEVYVSVSLCEGLTISDELQSYLFFFIVKEVGELLAKGDLKSFDIFDESNLEQSHFKAHDLND